MEAHIIEKILSERFNFPDWAIICVLIILIILLSKIAIKIFSVLIDRFFSRHMGFSQTARTKTVRGALFNTVRILIIFFALMNILELFGINTGSVLAAAGIGGIAIAFGAQKVVADIFSGFFLLVDNDMNVGDWVVLGNLEGKVISIGVRHTKLKAYSEAIYIIPNSEIKTIINHGQSPAQIQADIVIELAGSFDLEKALKATDKAIDRVYGDYPDLFVDRPKYLGLDRLGPYSYSMHFSLRSVMGNQYKAQRAMRESCLKVLQEDGAFDFNVMSGANGVNYTNRADS